MEIKDLNKEEIDIIKTKKKHIKVLASGFVGMAGMKVVSNLNVGVVVESIRSALGGSSMIFMGTFAVPNYFFVTLLLLCGSFVYANYKSSKTVKGGK